MVTFHVNMKQFNAKVKVYSDNIIQVENIRETKGVFTCFDQSADAYHELLNNYCIFYTAKQHK